MFKNGRTNQIIRTVSAVVALTLMGVIFFFSSQTGTGSDELSISFTSMLFTGDWNAAVILNSLIRKAAHITEFAALSVPVYFFFATFHISIPSRCAAAFCLTAVYAVSDEIHQLFVEGRACCISDMVIDSLGALLAVIVLNLIVKRLIGRRRKIKKTTAADGVFDVAAAFMRREKTSVLEVEDTDFDAFRAKLCEHKLLPLASFRLAEKTNISVSHRERLREEALADIVIQENKNTAFLRVYNAMTAAGAKPVCLKGCVCGALWSESALRISGDADILVTDEDFPVCREVLLRHGYKAAEGGEPGEICFCGGRYGNRIEIHTTPFAENSHISDFNTVVGDLCRNPISVRIDGVDVFCPAPQEHMVYLVLHAFKHFINTGVGIRQLMDIAFFCRVEGVDPNGVFEKCAQVSAEGFFSAVLLICGKYFGLDISTIQSPFFNRSLDCEMLLEDIKQGGIYGTADADKLHSAGLTVNSYAKSQNKKHPFIVFLPLSKMKKRYPYLNRFPMLLPVAWLQRVFRYAVSEHSAADSISFGRARIRMMKYYGIIK